MGARDPENQVDGDRLKTQQTMLIALFNYTFDLAMSGVSRPRTILPASSAIWCWPMAKG